MSGTARSSCYETSITSPVPSTTILWDLECCPIPRDYAGYKAVRTIKDFVSFGNRIINGFIAMGNFDQLDTTLKEDLQGSAIVLHNVSTERSTSAMDVAILGELLKITYFTKPPHSIILISGDRDFSKVLSFLESVQFHVTLIHSCELSDALRFSVKETVRWVDVLDIDNCSNQSLSSPDAKVKRFNIKKAAKNTTELTLPGPNYCSESSTLLSTFSPLIEYLQEQDSGSQTLINIETSLKKSFYQFGFKTFSDYIKAAEKNGVVVNEVHGSGKKIARLHNFGNDLFAKLIQFLQSASEDAVLFSKIGEECITKKVLTDQGFSSLRPYIEKASRCGIVKIIINEHGQRLAQLRPNYLVDSTPVNTASSVSLKIHIPKHKRGLLIGPNGANVLKLEKDLRVKLTLRDPYCFVSSDDQNLAEKAVAYLTSVYRGQTESEETIKMTAKTVKFQVPGGLVGQIKGRKGSKCHELEEEFGVDIDIPKLTANDDGNAEVSITIIGNELNILKAKEKILGIVKKHEHQQFSPHSFNKGDRAISLSTSTNASELSEDSLEYQISRLEKKSTSQPMKQGNSLSRTSSSEDGFTLSSKSLDSDQMTLSRSPSFLQAEQEALIPSFLLGNDSDETMSSSGILFSSPFVKDDANTFIHRHNLSPNRQKDVLTSLITIQDEHSRLYSYVNRD